MLWPLSYVLVAIVVYVILLLCLSLDMISIMTLISGIVLESIVFPIELPSIRLCYDYSSASATRAHYFMILRVY